VLLLGGAEARGPRAPEAGKLRRDDVGAAQLGLQPIPDGWRFRDSVNEDGRHARSLARRNQGLGAITCQTGSGPLPLISASPFGSHTNASPTRWYVCSVTCTLPTSPCDSMRLATLTASPHRS